VVYKELILIKITFYYEKISFVISY